MKKLRNKVFILVFVIFTVFTTGIMFSYNAQFYRQEYQAVEQGLNATKREFKSFDDKRGMNENGFAAPPTDIPENNDMQPEFEGGDFGNIRFIDRTVYTVLLDDSNNVSEIINHSENSDNNEEVQALAEEIIASGETKHLGNLYTEKYSYSYEENNAIVIIDNGGVNSELRSTLLITLLIYLLLELIIVLISHILSSWIAKPVAESFDKQKQFIADASHELKTPLAVIIASADALESNPS